MIRKILISNDPILRKKSKTVQKIDKKIQQLIKDMKETLVVQDDPEGIGLAAPQVGKNLQIFIMKPDKEITTIINPEIIFTAKNNTPKKTAPKKDASQSMRNIMEGCLSLPHFYGNVKRSPSIKIKYKDELGNQQKATFTGLKAQIVQHEIDHLNGRLFVDELIAQKRPLFEYKNGEWEEVEL